MQDEGVPVLIVGDEAFRPYSYKLESELERLAIEHSENLFGKDIHFFNVKKKIVSKSGIGSTPDGYLVDLANDKFFIIEIELSSHDIVHHIMNQLSRFKLAMANAGARSELAVLLAEAAGGAEGSGRNGKPAKVSDASYLSKVIVRGVGIFIIIDSISDQLTEVVEYLSKDGTDVRAIPFETYVNSRKQFIHKFTTFTRDTLEREAKKWTFKWTTVDIDKHFEKSDETVREVFDKLSKEICCLPHAEQVTRKGWTTFQTGKLKNFCTIKILKDGLEVNLKVDKKTFRDEKGVTRDLQRTPAWTFDKVFNIKSPSEVEYAISLIQQANQFMCTSKH